MASSVRLALLREAFAIAPKQSFISFFIHADKVVEMAAICLNCLQPLYSEIQNKSMISDGMETAMRSSSELRIIYFCSQCESINSINRCHNCEDDPNLTLEELEEERSDADRRMHEIEVPSLDRAVVTISCPHCGDHAFSGANTAWHKKIYSTPALAVFHCRKCERFYRYSPIPPQTSNLRIGEQ